MNAFVAVCLSVLFTFFIIPSYGEDANTSNEIRVQLATSSPLTPIYLGKIQSQSALFSPEYLSQLDAVFSFDLSYNGMTKPLKSDPQKESLLSHKENKSAFTPETWKNLGAAHVIKGVIFDRRLTVFVFSTQTGSLKQFPEVVLSGNLNEDRRQIHKLSDAILKALFNVEGIASQKILYSAQVRTQSGNGWSSEIWECDWDGANARQVTNEGSYCVTPVFMPARNDRFIYVSYKMGQPKIYIASLKEGVGHRFIDIRGNQLLPAISPQRDKVAFISDAAGRADLFIQPFHPEKGETGKPVQLFSYPRSTQASPSFNPDGSKIAFVSDKDGSPKVYVISAKTEGKRQDPVLITKQNSESSCPSWSPDGKKLAYSAKTKGIRQIWIYDFERREEYQLTYGPGNKENPSWASDSLHLVFNSTDSGPSELYLVNLNQPEAIKISRGPGKKHYPTWGRRL
jgi:TolB protein